jgi:hypothetical protein
VTLHPDRRVDAQQVRSKPARKASGRSGLKYGTIMNKLSKIVKRKTIG